MTHRVRKWRRLGFEGLEERRVLASLTVTLQTDEFDNIFAPDDLSLREALYITNLSSGPNTIQFAPALSGKTITLNNELEIGEDVTIIGPGVDRLTITTNGNKRLFSVLEGFRNVPLVEFRGMKLTGADTTDAGAAIRSVGANVIIRDTWITANTSAAQGGAIWVVGGTQNPGSGATVTVLDSTISGNAAASNGGAIAVSSGRLDVFNSTISTNAAGDQGGGIFVANGTVTITNSTIARNRADSDGLNDAGSDLGGGLARTGGAVTLRNSIVIGNLRGTGATLNDIQGSVAAASARNIVGHSGSAGGLNHGVNGNIVGVNGAGNLALNSVLEPNLVVSAGKTPTHNLIPASPAIDTGSNALAIGLNGAALTKDQRGISRIQDGDRNGTGIVDRGAVEFGLAPVLNVSQSITFNEQSVPKLIAPAATITDLDSTHFGGGELTVTLANATSADRMAVRNQGNGVGQIGVSANQIRFGGILIGTFVGGSTTPLRVLFNTNATVAATQALLRNLTLANNSDAPPSTARNVTFVVRDNTGLTSAPRSIATTIVPQNDAPLLGNQGTDSIMHNLVGNNPTKILALGTVTDPDSGNFAGGTLLVKVTQAAGADNRLAFAAPFSQVGVELRFNGTVIGTVNANGGIGTTQLLISLQAAATRAIVEQLVRNITFQISSPTGDDEPIRQIQMTLTDGDGGTSNTRTLTVDPEFIRG